MKKQLYTYNDPWELIDKWVFPRCFGCDSNAIYDQTIHLYRIDENSFGLWHHLRSGLTAVIAMYAAIFGMLAHLNVFWTIYGWIDIFWLLFCIFERIFTWLFVGLLTHITHLFIYFSKIQRNLLTSQYQCERTSCSYWQQRIAYVCNLLSQYRDLCLHYQLFLRYHDENHIFNIIILPSVALELSIHSD